MNSDLAMTIEPQTLTYINWRPPRPGIMTLGDLPNLQKSDCLFARKFDAKADPQVLDQLDAAAKVVTE